MIDAWVGRVARREINRSMFFSREGQPAIPPGDAAKNRLLYLHIPFCERLCPYCSFHRIPFEELRARAYFGALRKEIALYKKIGYDFKGIYVGGGTPTVLIDELESTLALARECFSIREVSVETNPNHLTAGNIEALKKAGVNRLSVGIQSFNDGLLKVMDRYDKYGSGQEIAEKMKSTLGHFNTLNADMIFNFASQTADHLEKDLDTLCGIGVDQITYYPLMVSDFTRTQMEKALGRAGDRREKKYYRRIMQRLLADYRFSSAWCFSRKKAAGSTIDEYIVDYDDYAGLGSGAIGYLQGTCYANTFNVDEYISRIDQGEIPLLASRDFRRPEQVKYDFLMKLFSGSLDVTSLNKKYGGGIFRHIWPMIIAFRLTGGLRYWGDRLYLTDRGRYYWVVMMREFFTAVNNFRDFCRADLH